MRAHATGLPASSKHAKKLLGRLFNQTIVVKLFHVGAFRFGMFDKFLRVRHRLFLDSQRPEKSILVEIVAALQVDIVVDLVNFLSAFLVTTAFSLANITPSPSARKKSTATLRFLPSFNQESRAAMAAVGNSPYSVVDGRKESQTRRSWRASQRGSQSCKHRLGRP